MKSAKQTKANKPDITHNIYWRIFMFINPFYFICIVAAIVVFGLNVWVGVGISLVVYACLWQLVRKARKEVTEEEANGKAHR